MKHYFQISGKLSPVRSDGNRNFQDETGCSKLFTCDGMSTVCTDLATRGSVRVCPKRCAHAVRLKDDTSIPAAALSDVGGKKVRWTGNGHPLRLARMSAQGRERQLGWAPTSRVPCPLPALSRHSDATWPTTVFFASECCQTTSRKGFSFRPKPPWHTARDVHSLRLQAHCSGVF